ncbi:O-antigen ligase family protein [Actinoplanes sp. NPDC089786]|uniref:O-antigen ligase family protein n=1 Tax=Actinoplanes sp. NPDC089786 TaxID=3155185 RepID=UPI00343E811C
MAIEVARPRQSWLVRPAGLPLWPLYAMFALMPVWWGLGVLYFVWPFFGLVLFILMATRGRIRRPAGTAFTLAFLILVAISAIRLEKSTTALVFSLRLGHLLTGFLLGVYVYNLARDGVAWSRIANPLILYWLGLVALGWFGVLAPTFHVPSPFALLLPDGIASERYVSALTTLSSTEFNPASQNPIYRPAAPYPYTNNWGTAYCFFVPIVLACLTAIRNRRTRVVLFVSLPLSVVPAYLTLNRGMFIGLGAGLLYLLGREIARGRVRLMLPIAVIVLAGWIITLFIPVVELIDNRTSTTASTRDRLDIYAQTWSAVMRSPLIGYGHPTTVDTTYAAEPLGTQGLLWQLLYSHGIPATIVFYLIFAVIARRMAAAVTPTGLWLSSLPVIAVIITPFYSYVDPNLAVLFGAIGLGLAAVDGPVNRGAT